MSIKQVLIPSWRLSEVNKREDGTLKDQKEVLKENMIAMIDEFVDQDPNDPTNLIAVVAREKMDDGNYRYGMGCIPTTPSEHEITGISLTGFRHTPNILISAKRSLIDTIFKVLRNLSLA